MQLKAVYLPRRILDDFESIAKFLYPNEGEAIVDGGIERDCFFVDNIVTGRFVYIRNTLHQEALSSAEFKRKTIAEATDGKNKPEFWLSDIDTEAQLSDEYRRFQDMVRAGKSHYPVFQRDDFGVTVIDITQVRPFLRWSCRSPERRSFDYGPFSIDPIYAVEIKEMTTLEGISIVGLVITAPQDGVYETKTFSLPVVETVSDAKTPSIKEMNELRMVV